ncbi:lF-82 [Salmonella enterica]|nr:lF-82 [Salmonella enterica]
MGGKDLNYQIVYRGEQLPRYVEGGWAMFQRPKECGGGYWFGRTFADFFWLEFERPTRLADAIQYVVCYNRVSLNHDEFIDNFELIG